MTLRFNRLVNSVIFALTLCIVVLATSFSVTLARAATDEENADREKRIKNGPYLIVSVRKFLVKGTSRIHLYLYGMDGALRKQLTEDRRFHDLEPVFDYYGKYVEFQREAVEEKDAALSGIYLLEMDTGKISKAPFESPRGGGVSRTPIVPYRFDYAGDFKRYISPDGTYQIRRETIVNPGEGGDRRYWLSSGDSSDKGAEPPLDILKLPSYETAATASSDNNESLLCSNDSPFLLGKDFAAIVLTQHRGSSDGRSLMALDLIGRKWTALSQNGGIVYHQKSDAGLFVATQERYQPLVEGNEPAAHTVNCSYLDWYGADWKRVRFSPPLSAFYSATIWRNPSEILYFVGEGVK